MILVQKDYMGKPNSEDLKIHAKGRKIVIIILHDEDQKKFFFEYSLLFFVITKHLVFHLR